ncbi:MAG TPA: aspartyl/asparaginyl beta-hydroxylase domain-containing protein [Verrucomicrobiae bacterium]|nr:aspartyl/asparaginyl beta-hydroxylase domain-containing protein [Verrucomicrobiae bacterium]
MTAIADPLALARNLAAADRFDEAAQAYRDAREVAPAEAATFLGQHAAHRQRWSEAVPLLREAARLEPANLDVLENLGLACERTGAIVEARSALERALAGDPQRFVARLMLGFVEHRQGRPLTALAHMKWAFQQARQRGFWLDASTTPAWLHDPVRGANAFMGRFPEEHAAAPLRGAGGDLIRVGAFIRGTLGLERQRSPDPRQAPKTHYFPGLPPSPWFDPALFPWSRRLEEAFPEILAEYLSVAHENAGFESFLTFRSAEQVTQYLGTTGPAPAWNAFFFYRHGVRNDENCRRCPKTAALLDDLPLIRLPGATPEICFSILTPGSHILPHRGDSNLRSVVHLGLVVPESCALNVAGEARGWEAGRVLAFDDTYEHEAWNRSESVRAVLLMDAWNPGLTETEKRVLPSVISEFDRMGREIERLKPVASNLSA